MSLASAAKVGGMRQVSSTGNMLDLSNGEKETPKRWKRRDNTSWVHTSLDCDATNGWGNNSIDVDDIILGTPYVQEHKNYHTADFMISSTSSLEDDNINTSDATNHSGGPRKVVLLKTNRKDRVLSTAQRQTLADSVPSPFPKAQQSPQWVDSLHILAANAASDQLSSTPLSSAVSLPTSSAKQQKQQRPPKPQSVWVENHRKERVSRQSQRKSHKKISTSSLSRVYESASSADDRSHRRSVQKPNLKRVSTAPSTFQPPKASVVDDELMNRAFSIRENLRHYEMQELAAEAERAAESGQKKFVGSASKFVTEETPPPKPPIDNGRIYSERDNNEDFVLSPYEPQTPMTRQSSFAHHHNLPPMDYTPSSYFSKKKIRVTALREFSEVVPDFRKMHNNIRIHLGQEGVDAGVLPDEEQHQLLRKNDTQETIEEEDDDNDSLASSLNAAGSITSFSSYAVASLKGIVDYVGGSKSVSGSHAASTSSTHYRAKSLGIPTQNNSMSPQNDKSIYSRPLSRGSLELEMERDTLLSKQSSLSGPSVLETNVTENSDSDDSSVELYGRKTTTASSLLNGMEGRMSPHSQQQGSVATWDNVYSRSLSEPADKILQRRKLFGGSHANHAFEDDKSQAPSIATLPLSPAAVKETSEKVAKFFSRIHNKFSRSPDDSTKKNDEENNKEFISNFFYTGQNAKIVNSKGISNLKLDINPDRKRADGFCISGCGQSDLLSSCETVGNMFDVILNWFSERGGDCEPGTAHSSTIDPKSPQIVLHQSWIKTWQTDSAYSGQRMFFMPPRLSVPEGEIIYQYSHEMEDPTEVKRLEHSSSLVEESDGRRGRR